MSPIERSQSAPSRRGRRIAILLAILLLVGLPLYLWPLRAGIQGLPGASALSGAPKDPRSAAAVAQLPADVWDGLMGHGGGPAGPKPPGNLTRISPHEDGAGNGAADGGGAGSAGLTIPRLGAGTTPTMTAMLAGGGAGSGGGTPADQVGDTSASSGFGSEPSSTGGGTGGQSGGAGNGGYSPFSNLGPFGGGGGPGGGNGGAPSTFLADPEPNDPPMPTPEPSTLMLVGSNLALIGALAWRYLRKREERKLSG
jgi:hypothetical protein